MRSDTDPIGLEVSNTGRILRRAFDEQLSAAGGSLPAWLILTTLKRRDHTMQRDIAAVVGIEDATLTHHLNRMERAGLIERRRAPDNRRTQLVSLTGAGDALFSQLLVAVLAFDERLRNGFSDDDLEVLRSLLTRLRTNLPAS